MQKIGLNKEGDHHFPMYGLYAYTEGKHIEAVRNLKFNGIPVLFLPGNAGSYKQGKMRFIHENSLIYGYKSCNAVIVWIRSSFVCVSGAKKMVT